MTACTMAALRCIGMDQQQHFRLLTIDAARGGLPLAFRLPHREASGNRLVTPSRRKSCHSTH